jgi:xyloglucan-specific endo-beta-1,4-glucanase
MPIPLSDVTNFTLSGNWSMAATNPQMALATTNIYANVAWDVFADENSTKALLETTAGYEIMFWVGSFGTPSPQPLGFAGGPCLTLSIGDIPL